MTLELAPQTAIKLRDRARDEGIGEAELANRLLETALDWESLPLEDDTEAIADGLRACEEGRVRPLEEFLTEHLVRYPTERS